MMLELKLSTDVLTQIKDKERHQRKLFIDLNSFSPDRDLMLKVSSRTLIDISTLRYLQNNSDKF